MTAVQNVRRRQRAALRLIHDAGALASTLDIADAWIFETAAEALANNDIEKASLQLEIADEEIDNPDVLVPTRDARQLLVAISDGWSA